MTAGSCRKCWPNRLRARITPAVPWPRPVRWRPQAAGIGASTAGQIQRRAVIDRGAHDGQSQGNVDGLTEAGVLEHRQSLVVIHGQHGVVAFEMARHEQRVRRYRAVHIQALCARLRDGRIDDAQFFIPQMPAFSGVRIQAAHRDAGAIQTPEPPQVGRHDGQHLQQSGRAQCIADGSQRQVGGGERHAQTPCHQHHDRKRRVGACGDVFGVTHEGEARLDDEALLHRCGDAGAEFAGEAAVHGAIDQREHGRAVGAIEFSGDGGGGQRLVQHAERTGSALRCLVARPVLQPYLQAEQSCTLLEHGAVGEADQRPAARPHGHGQAQIGADAGGFSRGQCERCCPPQRRSST